VHVPVGGEGPASIVEPPPLEPELVVPPDDVAPLDEAVAPDEAPDEDAELDVERTSCSDAPPQATAIIPAEPMDRRAGMSRIPPS
jgi:hypothetical protein